MRPRLLRHWLESLLIVALLGACQAPGSLTPGAGQPTPSASKTDGRPAETAATLEPEATDVLAFAPNQALVTAVLPDAPTAMPEPLRFVFPTPRPAPVSAWRPPLYPVPWAPTSYDHFYFTRPIGADQVNWPLQDYRYGGDFFGDVIHTGVDIPAPEGSDVLAAGPGKVVWAGYGLYRGGYDETDPYGIAIAIRHDFGYQNQTLYTMYGHLQEALVAVGQRVQTGQVIGKVGETGFTTGPHLHFEVRLGENTFFATRNPELWIAPPQGWGILAGQIMDSGGQLVERQAIIVTAQETGQNWQARSYGDGAVYADPYYRENIVVGDLPAGKYRIRISYAGWAYEGNFEILAGQVSYFRFYGREGFDFAPLQVPGGDFTPALLENSP